MSIFLSKEDRARASKEIRDPRLYSNLRGMATLESAYKRVKAHKQLDRRKDHTVLSAMKAGFGRGGQEKKSSVMLGAFLDELEKMSSPSDPGSLLSPENPRNKPLATGAAPENPGPATASNLGLGGGSSPEGATAPPLGGGSSPEGATAPPPPIASPAAAAGAGAATSAASATQAAPPPIKPPSGGLGLDSQGSAIGGKTTAADLGI